MGIIDSRWRTATLGLWILGLSPSHADVPGWVERLTFSLSPELRSVEHEIATIDEELKRMPTPLGINSGMQRGFQTGRVLEGEDLWIELTFPEPVEAEMVVLVPMLAKGGEGQVPGYGFPRRFQLEAQDDDGESYLLLDETADDFPNPEWYPVTADCPSGIKLARIRLTAIEPWARGGPEVLALAELMVLDRNRNHAVKAEVTTSSSRELPPTWSRQNLIDMVTPLGLPVAPESGHSFGWHHKVSNQGTATQVVAVDLGQIYRLDEIRIAPVWKPETPSPFNYGFPSRFSVATVTTRQGANLQLVHDQTLLSLQSPGQNYQCYELGGVEARYIEVAATRLRQRAGDYVFALAELEAYGGGENVALGAAVIGEESLEDREWGQAALTDGLVGNGRLLELSEWMRGLEQRHGLDENRVALVSRRRELLLQGEQRLVGGSIGASCGIGLLAGVLLWRGKRQRRIDREMHRERLARDLHDELGSNLGSIALISSFALEGESDESQMRRDLIEIEGVARESADSMRDMVDMLGGGQGGAANDWLAVMEGLAGRSLRGVELDCRLPDGSMVIEPDLETRREIYLFCKEVLHNIAKHAGAKNVRFHLKPKPDGLRIEIEDNGCGFDPKEVSGGHGLGNLKERATGLRATLNLASTPGTGTVVHLDVPRGRRWRKSKKNR